MPRLLPVALVLLLAPLAVAGDDWTGRGVKPKQDGLKLGRKFGGGLVQDGTPLDKAQSYPVKSDDDTYLELDGGFVFKLDVVVDPPKKVTNPEFAAWNKFPKGTAVVFESHGEGTGIPAPSPKKWKDTVTHTLVEVAADRVVVEVVTVRRWDDKPEEKLSRKDTHLRLIDAPPKLRPDPNFTTTESEETITVAGTKYKATKVREKEVNFDAAGSECIVETWLSDEVPGRLLRRDIYKDGTRGFTDWQLMKSVTTPAK